MESACFVLVDIILFPSLPAFPIDSHFILPEAVYESTSYPDIFANT